ncbi:MAG: putative phosphatase [Clostridia bacterium]|nr:putative phosphatase [Clostridia bacterium]
MKNIILDVDGTLWDTTELVAKAWNQAVAEVNPTDRVITSDILKKEFGKPMDAIADHLFYDVDEKQRALILEKCCAYEHDVLEACEDDLLFPGVKETVKKLSEKYRLFIVSNCQSGYIELFMKKAGVEDYITDYECFGDTGKSKGENIRMVIERNQLDEAVYVGDTQGDYEASVFAGVPFIFAKYGFGSPVDYYLAISEIKELLNIDEELLLEL